VAWDQTPGVVADSHWVEAEEPSLGHRAGPAAVQLERQHSIVDNIGHN
jgi:hypothetical protein